MTRFALVLALAAACGSSPPATAEFWGTKVEPPRGLAKIQVGMSVADAKRLIPELREDHSSIRDELVLDSGVADVRLELRLDGTAVAHVIVIVTGHYALEQLTKAWGEPRIGRDALAQHEQWWADETTGWKAKLDSAEQNDILEFVPYRASVSPEFFGNHVVPPGDLAKLRIGMPMADAKKLAPKPIDVRAGIPTGVNGVREFVAVDDKVGVVRAIYLNLPQFSEREIEQAWGPGQPATELVGKDVTVWFDPTTQWRATLKEALGYSHDLLFENYLPAEQLLGGEPDRIEALREPVLGRTADEIKQAYKTDVTVQGKDLMLMLPPTEWEHTGTRVTLELAGGKVKEMSFSLPFRAHPAARDTLLELFTKKWGEPRRVEEEQTKLTALVFREEGPHVEVHEDTDRGAWRVEIR